GSRLLMLPAIVPATSVWLAAALLGLLSASFLTDVIWLWRKRKDTVGTEPDPASGWLALALSLILLNAAVTFHNVWPTPAISWSGELSVELAVVWLVGLVLSRAFSGPRPVIRPP